MISAGMVLSIPDFIPYYWLNIVSKQASLCVMKVVCVNSCTGLYTIAVHSKEAGGMTSTRSGCDVLSRTLAARMLQVVRTRS
jgi:hypothetical protein